jgi:uncharacterized protein (DUF2345 family)
VTGSIIAGCGAAAGSVAQAGGAIAAQAIMQSIDIGAGLPGEGAGMSLQWPELAIGAPAGIVASAAGSRANEAISRASKANARNGWAISVPT